MHEVLLQLLLSTYLCTYHSFIWRHV